MLKLQLGPAYSLSLLAQLHAADYRMPKNPLLVLNCDRTYATGLQHLDLRQLVLAVSSMHTRHKLPIACASVNKLPIACGTRGVEAARRVEAVQPLWRCWNRCPRHVRQQVAHGHDDPGGSNFPGDPVAGQPECKQQRGDAALFPQAHAHAHNPRDVPRARASLERVRAIDDIIHVSAEPDGP